MKAVVAAFNQKKALVGALSVLTNLRMELFQALVGRCLYFSIFSKDLILYSNFAPDIGIMVLPPLVGRHQRGVSSAYRMRLCLISSQSRLINDLAAEDNKQGFTGEIN